ncbi:MAG: 50S ribosomal protein L15 [Chloroflexi bacterium]|nr:50S ribosomal protein L15 [Chloroflexota bacterium]
MLQNELKPAPGSKHRKKRVACGYGSGHGANSCRGVKGQKSRTGSSMRPGFEGGQLPLFKRLPRQRGFTNIFRIEYSVVNLSRLDQFDTEVTPEILFTAGLIKSINKPVKILGEGNINKAITIKAHRFSQSAKKKIEAVGGKIEQI